MTWLDSEENTNNLDLVIASIDTGQQFHYKHNYQLLMYISPELSEPFSFLQSNISSVVSRPPVDQQTEYK